QAAPLTVGVRRPKLSATRSWGQARPRPRQGPGRSSMDHSSTPSGRRIAAVVIALLADAFVPSARAQAPAPDPGWLASATAEIRHAEYHLAASADRKGWSAPNRAHGLRARWQDGVLHVTPRVDGDDWTFSFALSSVTRADRSVAGDVARPRGETVEGGRIEWEREGLVEWYVNDERGIEQGFVLEHPPAGSRGEPVIVSGAIGGLLAFPA